MLRGKIINMLSWFCSLTSLILVYGLIKWQKVFYFGDRMYRYINLTNPRHVLDLFENYFLIGGYSIFLCLLIAFPIDLLIRKTIIRL